MNAIVYSLFGYNREKYENCFTFDSYLCGMMLSIRLNRLVYPGWINVIETDRNTHDAFRPLFDHLRNSNTILIELNKNYAQLCEAMLWRLKPIFHTNQDGSWKFDHVICRDLDSLCTYREAQAVQQWINDDTSVHAMTDSVSHDVALMGGMVGFNPRHFTAKTNAKTHHELMQRWSTDLSRKGSDQTFMNTVIYPLVGEKGHDSITQHYFKGYGKTWLSHYNTCNCWLDTCRQGHKEGCKLDVKLSISEDMKETNEVSEHIGASGWNQTQTMALIEKHKDKFTDLIEIEKQYPEIFYWIRK